MVFARTAASRLLSLAAVAAATTAGTTAWGATTYALDTLGISDVAASVNPFGSAAAGISPDGKIAGPLVGSDGHNKPFLYTPGTATGPALWSVYFPAGETTIPIPVVSGGFNDYFQNTEAVLQTVSLGYEPTQTYDSIFQFDGVDADDLSTVMDQFSVRLIYR